MGLPAIRPLESDAIALPAPRLVYSDGGRPGPRRRGADNAVVGTAIFLGTETMVFAALISAFLILRAGSSAWPPLGQPRLPVIVTGLNTLVLLASAYTMRRATAASSPIATRGWLQWTAMLGLAFLVVQGVEWVRLLGYGLSAASSVYGATFYTLIGCHGLHVLTAVVVVTAVAWGEQTPARLQACGLYWLFVVGVWPVLYVLVYLS